jgi:arginyl-tRNA synthetase
MKAEDIKKIINKAVKKAGFPVSDFSVEQPKVAGHGDYSSNVALVISKQAQKNPLEVAKEIAGAVDKKTFQKIEVAPPGFINFYLPAEEFVATVKEILKEKDDFGKNILLKNKKIIIEYTDPNILKEFHIGHLMPNVIGESLSRIFEFNSAKIKRANYQSDVGLGIAKAVWGKMEKPGASWQDAYVFGNASYEKDENTKQEIKEINSHIFNHDDKKIDSIYYQGRTISLDYFETIYQKLGTKFDYYFFESEVAGLGKEIVEKNIGNVFEKGENGAIIFKGEKFGLHTRVFVNAEGLPTYEAKELALAKIKYGKFAYDESVVVTGNEINEYFKVLLAAMGEIFPELAKKTKHIGHGMMRLPEGKMSSRTGKVITFESLLEKVEELVAEKIKDRNLPEKEKKEITEKVAIGALKYSILKQSIGKDIIYDFEKSVNFQGDSGPYLQYSLARALSVLQKAEAEHIKPSLKKMPDQASDLEKKLHYFSETVEKAGKQLEPHIIVLYLTELASAFNHYYAENKIVDTADGLSSYKVALTGAFAQVMKNGLWLLGIHYVERM